MGSEQSRYSGQDGAALAVSVYSRPGVRGPACAVALSTILLAMPAGASEVTAVLKPVCRIGEDFAGATIADIALHSPNPALISIGATYKLAELAHALGDAAIEHENRAVDAEIVPAGEDA